MDNNETFLQGDLVRRAFRSSQSISASQTVPVYLPTRYVTLTTIAFAQFLPLRSVGAEFNRASVVNHPDLRSIAHERVKSFERNLRRRAGCDYTNLICIARFVVELAAQFIHRAREHIPGSVAWTAGFLVELIERPIHGGLDARCRSSFFALAH